VIYQLWEATTTATNEDRPVLSATEYCTPQKELLAMYRLHWYCWALIR